MELLNNHLNRVTDTCIPEEEAMRRIERQARWRPVWWVSLEQDDEIKELCVRGDRIDSPSAFPLEHEMAF